MIGQAKKYAFVKEIVETTINLSGTERNYVLTSRNANLEATTRASLRREFPNLSQENLMIRRDSAMSGEDFKAKCLWWISKTSPWTIFIDDSTLFIKTALDANLSNLLAINIPQGVIRPNFTSPNLAEV